MKAQKSVPCFVAHLRYFNVADSAVIDGDEQIPPAGFESSTRLEITKMAESAFDPQSPLNCPICLNLLQDPVTTSCGHSFCMDCINKFWDREANRGVYSCPECRKRFNQRPALSRNTVLTEILEGMKQEAPAGPGDVTCDVCKGRKVKAIKSCLVCMASYCQTHLRPHLESEAFKKHKLVEASPNLQQQICPQHHRALEVYCYDDRKCVCVVCMWNEHSGHRMVSAAGAMAQIQNYSSYSTLYQRTASPKEINNILAFENVKEYVFELKNQLSGEHMGRISKTVAEVHIFKNRFQRNQGYYMLLEPDEDSDPDWGW